MRCLSHVFHDYLLSGNMRSALLAVLQQINIAEKVNNDLHEVKCVKLLTFTWFIRPCISSHYALLTCFVQQLIIAYACMMEYCQENYWPQLGATYEFKAQIR